jgi:hypothetical protein
VKEDDKALKFLVPATIGAQELAKSDIVASMSYLDSLSEFTAGRRKSFNLVYLDLYECLDQGLLIDWIDNPKWRHMRHLDAFGLEESE